MSSGSSMMSNSPSSADTSVMCARDPQFGVSLYLRALASTSPSISSTSLNTFRTLASRSIFQPHTLPTPRWSQAPPAKAQRPYTERQSRMPQQRTPVIAAECKINALRSIVAGRTRSRGGMESCKPAFGFGSAGQGAIRDATDPRAPPLAQREDFRQESGPDFRQDYRKSTAIIAWSRGDWLI